MGFLRHLWWWIELHTGTVHETGPFYGFFSGFGSDLGEITLITAVIAAWRHKNCHHPWCLRTGKPVEGTPYIACHRHHPAHRNAKRATTAEEMRTAWDSRRR